MIDHSIRRTLDALLAVDVEVADHAELILAVSLSGKLRAWIDAVDVAVARRTAAVAAGTSTATVTEILGDRGRRSGKEARAAAERAAVCDRMSGFEDALAGTIAAGHVDAVAHATRNLDEAAKAAVAGHAADLLAAAASQPVAAFEKDVRDLTRFLTRDDGESTLERQRRERTVRRWIDKTTGMHHLHATLDAEAGSKLWTALDAQVETVKQRAGNAEQPLERLTADALVELVTHQPAGARRVPEISVLVDWRTLTDGIHQHSLCETSAGTPLPVATVRRLCCEADVIPMVLGTEGQLLDCGRERRVANREQRRALAALYRTCGHPDCDVTFDHCVIHHVIPWERFGPTDWVNLIPLCDRHHHLVHEGRWRLTMTSDRTVTLHRPDSTHYFTGRTTDRAPRRHPTRSAGRTPTRPAGHPPGKVPA